MRGDVVSRDLDRQAEEFARRHGVDLPHEIDTGRLVGDRYHTQGVLRGIVDDQRATLELRHYREVVLIRLAALDNAAALAAEEREVLAMQAQFLHLLLDGDGLRLEAIAAHFGRRSHSWASERLAEIRVAAAGTSPLGSVATPCRCGDSGCVVTTFREPGKQGRPRAFASNACRGRVTMRRHRQRKKVDLGNKRATSPADARRIG